jgi:CheY-like chemotaxis protein
VNRSTAFDEVTYTEFPSSLPCPTCGSAISLQSVEWCQCVTRPLSVVCPACRNCACKLRNYPKRAEWTCVIRELIQKQTEEKFRRALNTDPMSAGTGPTVLVVDDDEEIRLIAEYSIQQMGYHVITAAGPEAALAIIEKTKPDIVLTDALMPKIDGRQLCKLIKTSDASIKVVIMTALYKSSRYRTEAMHTFHADEYLAKPIDFAHLRQVLGNLSARIAA